MSEPLTELRCSACKRLNRVTSHSIESGRVPICGACGERLFLGFQWGLQNATNQIKVHQLFIGLLVVLFGAAITGLYQYPNISISTFLFILTFWIVSICIHEFAHAFTAFIAGEDTVVSKSYLTLNPLSYFTWNFSLILPFLIFFNGGIGFPGAAVFINRRLIQDRRWLAAVSAAGPAANVAIGFFVIWLISISNLLSLDITVMRALSFAAFLQIQAALFNLLPIPGLDGFGILYPFLPKAAQQTADKYAALLSYGFFFMVFFNPTFSRELFQALFAVTDNLGIQHELIRAGYQQMRFWR